MQVYQLEIPTVMPTTQEGMLFSIYFWKMFVALQKEWLWWLWGLFLSSYQFWCLVKKIQFSDAMSLPMHLCSVAVDSLQKNPEVDKLLWKLWFDSFPSKFLITFSVSLGLTTSVSVYNQYNLILLKVTLYNPNLSFCYNLPDDGKTLSLKACQFSKHIIWSNERCHLAL